MGRDASYVLRLHTLGYMSGAGGEGFDSPRLHWLGVGSQLGSEHNAHCGQFCGQTEPVLAELAVLTLAVGLSIPSQTELTGN